MKIKEVKHNHNLTTILKSCLFGLIMILPFLAILPSTLYFAFNEHAENYTHEEVITTYEYETNEVNSVDDLVVGNIYKLTFNKSDIQADTLVRFVDTKNIYINDVSFSLSMNEETESGYLEFRQNVNNTYYIYCYNNVISTNICTFPQNIFPNEINLYFTYYNNVGLVNDINNISASDYLGEKNVEVIESEQSPLNAFNTASTTIWNSPIFNWVNSGLGSIAIANMLTIFGIARNTFISNILIYWLSITAIYIIIDIVITAFTILTHLITKKAE